jgi:AraC-like DNA-binding protein
VEHGGQGETTSIICGFVQCDELLFHPILRPLPLLLHVSPDASPADRWLATTIRHTTQEATQPSPGSRNMLPRLTELLFVEILRKHMRGLTDEEVGWFAAFNDEIAGAALQCLHIAPFDEWGIEKLASRIGVSRTVLADRFKHFLDQPPMQYLTHWRLISDCRLVNGARDRDARDRQRPTALGAFPVPIPRPKTLGCLGCRVGSHDPLYEDPPMANPSSRIRPRKVRFWSGSRPIRF